ncbi:MAG: GNAT family N-acetyltransferase [Flavobacterium sp.]|uniref:GNAT family N-acetyltransferase n=1 Tax=Flavobacterium sp. TaxID=239 RepID=UPI00120342B8|nr:GNAT family N-acetyltransferase [Flavobacterium sp.]RZJ66798.1 MAG: GNAT family N-acetyltransferase [Flavobacterium sp.]
MIAIRKVKPDELATLREISVKTFNDKFASENAESDMSDYISKNLSPQKLLEEFSNPDSAFYFALSDEIPIGYLKINTKQAQTECRDQNSLEVERIYVDEAFQGKTIGQNLFEKAIKIAVDGNFDFIWLGVWEHNDGAIKFYVRNGFEIFGKHEFWLGKDLQFDLLMKREIKQLKW